MLTINAISDALKGFAQSLQLAFFLPSLIMVAVNAYFVAPRLWSGFKPDDSPTVLLTVAVTMLLSYTLYAFNFPLIRFVEGYKFAPKGIGKILFQGQRDQYDSLQARLSNLMNIRVALREKIDQQVPGADPDKEPHRLRSALAEEWRQVNLAMAQIERRLDTQFPPERLLPTQRL